MVKHTAKAIIKDNLSKFTKKVGLSKREGEILECLLTEATSAQGISEKLKITPNTIANHMKSILDKLGVSSKSEAVLAVMTWNLEQLVKDLHISRPLRVLIVDDEADLAETISDGLAGCGLSTFIETNAHNVLQRIQNEFFDIVISDIQMPDLDGFQMLQKIREPFPHLPLVYFMTGHSKYTEEDCLHHGAAGVMYKPFTIDMVFKNIIDHYLDSYVHSKLSHHNRVESNIPVQLCNTTCKIDNIGYGGVFIHFTDEELLKKLQLKPGDHVSVNFALDSKEPIAITCEIVWLNQDLAKNPKPGFGARFRTIKPVDLETIRKYVRTQKIKSYIPKSSS